VSGLVSSAQGPPLLAPSDCRHVAEEYNDSWLNVVPLAGLQFTDSDFLGIDDFDYPYWPAPGALLGSGALADVPYAVAYQRVYPVSGCNGRLAFNGVTRDAYGSPVAGARVRCFRASTGELVAQVTSDANGNYIATSPYNEAHLVTMHYDGPPAIAGCSLDTVIPL
jgi:hypothetical protein